MELAGHVARTGNRFFRILAGILILMMLFFGGWSLWENFQLSQEVFSKGRILQYKPGTDGSGGTYSLDELAKLNPDTRGWLTIEGTHIDYPVVQGEDDMTYINKNVFGEFALTGSIFLSCMNSPDFSDPYNLIYGHHMDNGGMFGDVMEFLDSEYFDEHPEGELVLPEKRFRVVLFACLETNAYDPLVYHPGPEYQNENLLEELRDRASVYREIGVNNSDKIVGMSTCVDAQTDGRVVLFGKLE